MNWSYGHQAVDIRLPFGASWLVPLGSAISAGEVVARGTAYRATRRIAAADALGCRPEQVRQLLRVGVGQPVRAGAVLARTGRRFARGIVAKQDGRLVHLGADGDLHLGTVRHDWEMRATLDGTVRRSDPRSVVVAGEAWALQGLAAFGPSQSGTLAFAVQRAEEEIAPGRLDVSLSGRILVGGAQVVGEALTRGHAVGVRGIVAAAASFRALLPIYGQDATAWGLPTLEDVPTVLVLGAFGSAPFPAELFDALRGLDGARASIEVPSARLFVLAPEDASESISVPDLEPLPDLSGARIAD